MLLSQMGKEGSFIFCFENYLNLVTTPKTLQLLMDFLHAALKAKLGCQV
jgi:hypothetical protein